MLTLELLSETHKFQVQELANDAEVSVTSGVDFPFTEDMAQEWLECNRQPMPEELYFVVLRAGQPTGGCALKHIDYQKSSAFLGYWIGQRFWGQGLGFEAARMLRDYAFSTLKLQKLHALCLVGNNQRSTRILHKVGLVPDPAREDRITSGRWGESFPCDHWRFYVLTRERWLALPTEVQR